MLLLRQQPSNRLSVYSGMSLKLHNSLKWVSQGWGLLFHSLFLHLHRAVNKAPLPEHVQRSHVNESRLKQGRFNRYVCWSDNIEEINAERTCCCWRDEQGSRQQGKANHTGQRWWWLGGAGIKEPIKVYFLVQQMIEVESSVCHSVHTGQALITQPQGSLLMMLMITTIGKETGHLYWKVAMATHCHLFSAH